MQADAADAEAICEAVTRPTMRFVEIKTPEQQSASMLHRVWSTNEHTDDGLAPVLSPETLATLDPFDRVHLSHVVATCRSSRTLSEAGRTLFAASRARRTSSNDADRLRKYLQRFGLEWSSLAGQ